MVTLAEIIPPTDSRIGYESKPSEFVIVEKKNNLNHKDRQSQSQLTNI